MNRNGKGLTTIIVGTGTCGLAAGAGRIHDFFAERIAESDSDNLVLKKTGCLGYCTMEPIVDIELPKWPRMSFGPVTLENAELLWDMVVEGGAVPKDFVLGTHSPADGIHELHDVPLLWDTPFFRRQKRLVLRNSGIIDPESLDEYVQIGGYRGLESALRMSPEEVVAEVKRAGLRGRGGAGFPTGLKWQFAQEAEGDEKYIICNADEGDPGAFMDRSILEGDPHAVIEGLAIAAYAIGASEGYVYCRAEYPLAIARLTDAISQAEEAGYLGDNIGGSEFSFKLKIKKGAGAFVCGEETALIASIEGKRGMPRPRPPYPAQSGLWGKPTNINNVETIANVPLILDKGAEAFRKYGTDSSPGTKVFALAGKVKRSGLVEAPMGMSLRDIIFDIGGGVADDREFKAVQIGGPSGGCLPDELLDTPVDYDSLVEAGAMMGSGGMVVMDEDTCMVDVARFFLNFTASESCGKCLPCREGVARLRETLNGIVRAHRDESSEESLLRFQGVTMM
ncbi:MAG: NADH-ubiquinone oxidoreductase-F iron-sulfur binding region domain-containing protein, partial [Bacillota bacterium]